MHTSVVCPILCAMKTMNIQWEEKPAIAVCKFIWHLAYRDTAVRTDAEGVM